MRALALAVLLAACGGGKWVPACADAGEYCVGHDGAEMCCGGAYPYCGRAGSNCPPGFCCSAPPR